MKYWLFVLVSILCVTMLFYLKFSRAAEPRYAVPHEPSIASGVSLPAGADQEIRRVEREVDQIEKQALAEWRALQATPPNRMDQVRILGKLLLFDKNLSVNRNEACSFCHMPDTDFTGPISILNQTTVAYPGSVRTRVGHRKPQSYTYAPFFPPLRYNSTQQDFYGGNFWDLRATGYKLQNPAAEQAQGPPLDPNEMGLPDSACLVRRLSESEYRPLFEAVWGDQAFAIRWPADIERICSRPGPAPDPDPVRLSKVDRGRSNSTYDQFGLAIAMYEASPEVSPFTSKFDYALAHPDKQVLSQDELAGWNLFRGRARCNTCHLDGMGNRDDSRPIAPGNAASVAPLFTDFTSNNIGIPRNPAVPYYSEDRPDPYGYTANPAGAQFIDKGVGDYLRGPDVINFAWRSLADSFDGKFQTSTLRNVDKRPMPGFVKAYMHNGYFKSLKEVVHFYNTRDTLGLCRSAGDPGQKVSCWPAPEASRNLNTTIGRLGLSDQEENQVVAFMQTLTDGYAPPK